jgi:uncharacterized protein YndB with AHSA1/START domain
MDSALKAIADPNRRHILVLVAAEELAAGEIAAHFGVTRPAISQHLTILKAAGLIRERREGTRRLYRTRREGFAEAKLLLESLWDDRLGRLKRASEDAVQTDVITERLSVQREILIAASAQTVWELLTDPNKVTQWMGVTALFDLSPGGAYRIEVVPGQLATGEFILIDPPHRLAHTWGWEIGDAAEVVPAGSTIVEIELTAVGSDTVLTLTHEDLPGVRSVGSHSRGWAHYLERLAKTASGGSPDADPWITDPRKLTAELRP